MENRLNANKDYVNIHTNDPTVRIQTDYNNLVSTLHKKKLISEQEAKNLKVYNANSPRVFGTIKLHKIEQPVREIVDQSDSPLVKISDFLEPILTKAFIDDNNQFVKDTFSLTTELNNFQLPKDYIIVSLDVTKLFPSITWSLVKRAIEENWDRIAQYTEINKTNFLLILKFIIDNSYFSFNKGFYRQINGLPMGGKLSPILSKYVMKLVLKEVTSKLGYQLPFLKIFVDDILLAIPLNAVARTLQAFNSFNKRIQFTIEEEDQSKTIPFLDTRVHRTDENRIIFSWYRKPQHSGRYLHFDSYTPFKYKINLVKTLTFRIRTITNSTMLAEKLKEIHNLLIKNGYPNSLITPIIYNTSNLNLNNNNGDNNQNLNNTHANNNGNNMDLIIYKPLPYLNNLSSLIQQMLSNTNVKIANKPYKTEKTLYPRIKGETDKLKTSHVIYKINCENCQSVYIGQTMNYLRTRLYLHKSSFTKNPESCALARHVIQTKHTANLTNVNILAKCQNNKRREFIESCYINEYNHIALNSKTDTGSLNIIYSHLLNIQKTKNLALINN